MHKKLRRMYCELSYGIIIYICIFKIKKFKSDVEIDSYC